MKSEVAGISFPRQTTRPNLIWIFFTIEFRPVTTASQNSSAHVNK